MSHKPISRRTVLRGLGCSMALPALEAMLPGSSFAAEQEKPPVRMAFLYVPNGVIQEHWIPAKEGTDYELKSILKPIEKFKSKLNVLGGLTLNGARALGDGGGDHARSVASYLTGAHPKKTSGADITNGASVDQIAAQHIGKLTRLPSLELGMEASAQAGRCDSGYSCAYASNMSWRTEKSPVAKEVNPSAVFDRLFGSANEHESAKAKAKRDRYRKSVLDFVKEDASSLQRKLGHSDRMKLDEYLYAVREIERRITDTEKLRGVDEEAPDFPRPEGVPAEFGEHVKLMFDMMVLAFQTDSTRISTFMYANAGSNRSYKNINVPQGHHGISHHNNNKDKVEKLRKINEYHVVLLKYLLERLDGIKEQNGTLLDNCMLMYGSGIGDGNRHSHHDLPIALFGSGGGSIQTGRHIRYKSETPLTNLYLSLLDRVGVKLDKFSDSNGRLDNLSG